ncbi:MAG: TonB-dependent receptor plug domain-containing protein [Calditrichaeota bacterium]|nr:TonB-dependent receptor plug domain-containing protein [Calditrichota bacterium]
MHKKGVFVGLVATLVAIALVGAFNWSFAGTTGKIAGVVKDADTGEPLPGVNVVIVGTQMGAATNENGYYFIIGVPPGVYTVRAQMIGYTPVDQQDVRVFIDRTTTVNFELKPTVVSAPKAVVVTAQRELVRKDVSYTQTNVSADVINKLPTAFNLQQALTTQVGVSKNAEGLVIRRSDNTEIAYLVDGLNLKDEQDTRPFAYLPKTNIQEVQLLTGSFSAEYGDARGGVVNIVSRTPKQKFFLNFEGQISPLIGGDDPDHPGLKHFGPYIFSDKNWWEYGRYDWNDGQPAPDKDGDGEPDFIGWNAWAADHKFHGEQLSPWQAYQVWQWQHRSEDGNGNVLYNDKKIGTVKQLYQSPSVHSGPLNYYGYNPDWNFDFTIGGPVPFYKKLSFVATHRREYTMYPFFVARPALEVSTTSLKLIHQFNPNMRLRVEDLYSDVRDVHWSDYEPYKRGRRGTVDAVRGAYGSNKRVYNNDSRIVPMGRWYNFAGVTWTHTLSPKTFYEIRAQYNHIHKFKIPGLRERNLGAVRTIGPVTLDEAPKGWSYRKGDKRDILNIFEMRGGGDGRGIYLGTDKTVRVAGDLTSQVTINHQIKAGFEWQYDDIAEYNGYIENYLWVINEKFRKYGPDMKPNTGDEPGQPGDQANWHDVHVFQWYLAGYIRDRMEYGGMILNIGVRVDAFQPFHNWYDRNDIYMPSEGSYWNKQILKYGPVAEKRGLNYYGLKPDVHPPLQVRISPRLGVSHPIGPESKIYFNYGHFYQKPPREMMYRFQLGYDEPLEELGNPWLRMPRTIQFEAGYEQRLYRDWVLTIRSYYKDVTGDIDRVGISSRSSGDPDYAINARGRDIKGIEMELAKRYGRYITGFLNVNYDVEKLSRYGWSRLYHPESQQAIKDPTYIQYLRVVQDPDVNVQYPGSWGAKLSLAITSPSDFGPGPMLLGSKPLGNWLVSIYHTWRQGAPYSWNPDGLQSLRGVYNHRLKDYNWTDLHLEKRFGIGGVNVGVYAEIWNLFNVKNVYNAFGAFTSRQDRSKNDVMLRQYAAQIFKQGKKWGDEVDEKYMPQRYYLFWGAPRDYWFGLRVFF